MVQCQPGPWARMCAAAVSVKHIVCDGHHNRGSADFRGDLGDRLGIGVSRSFAKKQNGPGKKESCKLFG